VILEASHKSVHLTIRVKSKVQTIIPSCVFLNTLNVLKTKLTIQGI
jgi:hypothetical protein